MHNSLAMTFNIYEEIVELRRRGTRAALATIVVRKGSTPRKDSAKMLVYEDGRQMGTIGGGCTEAEVCKEALLVMRSEKPKLLRFDLTDEDADASALLCGGTMEVYVEPILPDPTLIVFGAGHVGQAVAEITRMIGFKVSVADDRIKYANADRFPHADALYVDTWDEIFKKLPVDTFTFLLIATRGHQYDLACLRFALQSPAQYIGLMGSRRKTKLLYEALQKEGMDKAIFQRVYSPVGLEIGSETPEEIAVSIAAELVAVRKRLDVHTLRKALHEIRAVHPEMKFTAGDRD
jgi:xanthine dehydrogenase accessory factor